MPPSRRGPKLWSPISVGGPCVILVLPGLLARIEKTSMAQTGQACPVASLVRVTCHGPLLAYDLHEDLLPVLAGLEAMVQGRALGERLQLLLQEVFPAEVV